MTGLAGGGHAIWWDADEQSRGASGLLRRRPGSGRRGPRGRLLRLAVPFGTELVHYAVGIASCAVPGRAGRARRALRARTAGCRGHGSSSRRSPSQPGECEMPARPRLVPGDARARDDDARRGERIYSPGGRSSQAGERLEQPGLAAALALLAEEGPESMYNGLARRRPAPAHGGARGPRQRGDLTRTSPNGSPCHRRHAGYRIETRGGLARVVETLAVLPPMAGLSEVERVSRSRRRAGRDRARRPHDEPRDRRRAGERLRPHDEPRPRLRATSSRARPPSEQHARRGRPRSSARSSLERAWRA